MTMRCATNGGLLFIQYADSDIAVILMDTRSNCLLAMTVHPQHRRHGLASAIVRMLMPNFIRATSERVPYFQSLGYVAIGAPKRGKTLLTQIMVRESLMRLAGRMRKVLLLE